MHMRQRSKRERERDIYIYIYRNRESEREMPCIDSYEMDKTTPETKYTNTRKARTFEQLVQEHLQNNEICRDKKLIGMISREKHSKRARVEGETVWERGIYIYRERETKEKTKKRTGDRGREGGRQWGTLGSLLLVRLPLSHLFCRA